MRVVILYNAPVSSPDSPEWVSEAGVLESVEAAALALHARGHHVRRLAVEPTGHQWVTELLSAPPDVVVNLAEAALGRSSAEPLVASFLELLNLPFTGSQAPCLALVHDKPRTKWLLRGAGIPTAEFTVVRRGARCDVDEARRLLALGPLFVKPAAEDASLGISAASVVRDETALAERVAAVGKQFGDVLVEQFIDGREVNVAVVALPAPTVLPLAEIEFNHTGLPILTYDAKWDEQSDECRLTPVRCPAVVDPSLAAELRRLALTAFALTGCRDYGRVDFRIDRAGQPYVLEVNGNPDIGPTAGFARAWGVAGYDVADLYVGLVEQAAKRAGVAVVAPTPRAPRVATRDLRFRPVDPSERSHLISLVAASPLFRPEEVAVADEVLCAAVDDDTRQHFRVGVADDGVARGWACWGQVQMTDATWDLYWIVVDPRVQGRGIGTAILREVEQRVRAEGGRWLLAETSSSAVYVPTRGFYAGQGYAVVSHVADFYRLGDGRVTYGKRLDPDP